MEKCYYAYCRPKLPNHPWSLERIPFGKSILTTSKDAELKSKKCIPFDVKVTDDIGITLNQDGTFSLPIGKYMIDIQTLAELPVAGSVSLSIDNQIVSDYLQASTPSTILGKVIIEVTENGKSIGVFNPNKDTVKVSDSIVIISKL